MARIDTSNKNQSILIIGGGVFGLSTALHLTLKEGYKNVTVVDRTLPPVPDGSSVDVSRIIRFDYADEVYSCIAREAFAEWANSPTYKGSFNPTPFMLVSQCGPEEVETCYLRKTTCVLDKLGHQWHHLPNPASAKTRFPQITGPLPQKQFQGYYNEMAGWADAAKAIRRLREDCVDAGISFVTGARGTVTKILTDARDGLVTGVETLSGHTLHAEVFILSAGAWSAKLVPMDNTVISTAQAIGFIKLTPEEMDRLDQLPIYLDFTSGWFCFPPHRDTQTLKIAVHGYGYTRSEQPAHSVPMKNDNDDDVSCPPTDFRPSRVNFTPEEAQKRLREGIKQVLPEFQDRPFDKTTVCWYTDTPTGDFIIDHHPRYPNLLLATGGSGHAFKFLPILGRYVSAALHGSLPAELQHKWRFRTELRGQQDVFKGDGSRGGPERREFTLQERAKL